MANEITIGLSLAFKKNGLTSGLSIQDTLDQQGEFEFNTIVDVGATTVQIPIGQASGDKWLMLKNLEPKDTTDVTSPIIYADTVTPVVPSSAPIKMAGSHGDFRRTTGDTWYAIAVGGVAKLGVQAVQV